MEICLCVHKEFEIEIDKCVMKDLLQHGLVTNAWS